MTKACSTHMHISKLGQGDKLTAECNAGVASTGILNDAKNRLVCLAHVTVTVTGPSATFPLVSRAFPVLAFPGKPTQPYLVFSDVYQVRLSTCSCLRLLELTCHTRLLSNILIHELHDTSVPTVHHDVVSSWYNCQQHVLQLWHPMQCECGCGA